MHTWAPKNVLAPSFVNILEQGRKEGGRLARTEKAGKIQDRISHGIDHYTTTATECTHEFVPTEEPFWYHGRRPRVFYAIVLFLSYKKIENVDEYLLFMQLLYNCICIVHITVHKMRREKMLSQCIFDIISYVFLLYKKLGDHVYLMHFISIIQIENVGDHMCFNHFILIIQRKGNVGHHVYAFYFYGTK